RLSDAPLRNMALPRTVPIPETSSPDISPDHPRMLAGAPVQPIQSCLVCALGDLGATRILAGFWPVLVGHIANRMIYWLRRSSPICLAQSSAKTSQVQYPLHLASFERSGLIPRPDEISGLARSQIKGPTLSVGPMHQVR